MKKVILATILLLLSLSVYSEEYTDRFTKSMSSSYQKNQKALNSTGKCVLNDTIIWQNLLAQPSRESKVYALDIASDNNIYAAGTSRSDDEYTDSYDFLVKLSPDGQIINQITLPDFDGVYDLKISQQGNLFLTGSAVSNAAILRKADINGQKIWDYTSNMTGISYIIPGGVSPTSEGGAVICFTEKVMGGGYIWKVLKFNSSGEILWSKDLDPSGSGSFSMANDIDIDNQGNIALCGAAGLGYNDRFTTLKLDKDGNLLWQNVTDDTPYGSANATHFLSDGRVASSGTNNGLFRNIVYSKEGVIVSNQDITNGHYVFGSQIEGYNIITVGCTGDYYQGCATVKSSSFTGTLNWSYDWQPFYDVTLYSAVTDQNGDFIIAGLKKDSLADYSGDAFITKLKNFGLKNEAPKNLTISDMPDSVKISWQRYQSRNPVHNRVYLNGAQLTECSSESFTIPKSSILAGNNTFGVSNYVYGQESTISTISYSDINDENLIGSCAINSIYPNPFNPSTAINYNLNRDGMVKIGIYNIRGEKVTELLNSFQTKGSYNISLNMQQTNTNLTSGVYYCQLLIDNKPVDCKKIMFIK